MRRATVSTESTSSAISILPHAGEGVDQHRDARALGPLEQQRRTAALHGAVGELGDLEHRVHFHRDALQLAVLLQRAHEVPQVRVGHTV